MSTLLPFRLPYPPFQSALSFTPFTLPLAHSMPLPFFNFLSSFCPSPSLLTRSLILWLLGLSSIQPLLWNQLTNSSPDKLPISCGQRKKEKRDWSSIEPIAVLLNVPSDEEGRRTRGGGKGENAFKCARLSVCPWGVYNFGSWGYLWVSVGVCVHMCVRSLRRCVSSSPPPARVHHFLYAEVNDLAVQSHSPVRPPSPTATGGLANWYPAERKSRGRKRREDDGWRKSEWRRPNHESVGSPK